MATISLTVFKAKAGSAGKVGDLTNGGY